MKAKLLSVAVAAMLGFFANSAFAQESEQEQVKSPLVTIITFASDYRFRGISQNLNDPVLQLAMPNGDSHEYAEERRLFYVALTRARSTVTLITIARKESPFVTELVKDQKLEIQNADGSANTSEVCPSCGTGFLVPRKGKNGPFFGCTGFPKCKKTRNVPSDPRQRSSGPANRLH